MCKVEYGTEAPSNPQFPGNFQADVDSVWCAWIGFLLSVWGGFGIGFVWIGYRFEIDLGSMWGSTWNQICIDFRLALGQCFIHLESNWRRLGWVWGRLGGTGG